MIRALAVFDEDGVLRRFEAQGHSGYGLRGANIVCAAFTVLARTAYSALAALPGALADGRARSPGSLDFAIEFLPKDSRERAIGISCFLAEGLAGLEREFPTELDLKVERLRRN